jgi:hypothetical protein
LKNDRSFRRFFEQETVEIPQFIVQSIRKDLGEFWDWLPKGALYHDPNAYLMSTDNMCNSCLVPRTGVA